MNVHEPYKILEELVGNCFLVRNEADGTVCLLKVLRMYERSVFEYLRRNRDKHVPIVFDMYEDDGELYVFEEYIQGETLYDLMLKDCMTREQKISILEQLCDGLGFLHSAPSPIIHRDIKPQNIMVTSDFVVKIVDYDAAKTYKRGAQKDTVFLGTPDYAAPEQYGYSQSDPRTDVFAIGKIIEEMFPRDRKMRAIVKKACAIDPEARYRSAKALKNAIGSSFMQLLPPPGFRQLKWWHMTLAILYYSLATFLFFAVSNGKDWPLWKHIFFRFEVLFIFAVPVDILFNWTGLFLYFPIPVVRKKNKIAFWVLGILYVVGFIYGVRTFNMYVIP